MNCNRSGCKGGRKKRYEQGIITRHISGRLDYGWDGGSHAWLETPHGVVIDITRDQYKYKTPRFTVPVYAGPRADGFHDMFEPDPPVAYVQADDPFGRNAAFDKRYNAVMKRVSVKERPGGRSFIIVCGRPAGRLRCM